MDLVNGDKGGTSLPVLSDSTRYRAVPSSAGVREIDINTGNYNNLTVFAPLFKDKLDSLRDQRVAPPIHVRIKPTNVCNHGCFYCTYADRKEGGVAFSHMHASTQIKDSLPRDKVMEILDDFKEMGVKAITYSGGGEPLLYPYIRETLEQTLEYGIDLAMITHGQFLMEPRAEALRRAAWVRISQDAVTSEMFERIRGNRTTTGETFKKVKLAVAGFAKVKAPRCELGINFVVSEINKDHVYDGAKMWKELGVNRIRFSPVWSPDLTNYHAPFRDDVEEQVARAKQDLEDGKFKVFSSYRDAFRSTGRPERHYSRCYVMQINPAIGADQNVYFCHNKAYDNTGKLGSIKDRSFKDLWFSEETARIFKEFDPQIHCRHECAGDLKNVALNQALGDSTRCEELTSFASQRTDPDDNFA